MVSVCWAGLAACSAGLRAADEPPRSNTSSSTRKPGRFAGWPANHGIWSWGDEILVGFSRGFYKDRDRFHHIDKEKPEEFLLARSKDGGATWSVEQPRPPGAWPARWACGTVMPPGASPEQPTDLHDPIDFTHPDFAMTIRMENTNAARRGFISPTTAATVGAARTGCRCSARKA